MRDKDTIILEEIYNKILQENLKAKRYYMGMKNPVISYQYKKNPSDSISRNNTKVEILNILNANHSLTTDAIYYINRWNVVDIEHILRNLGYKKDIKEMEEDHIDDTEKENFNSFKSLFDWVIEQHPITNNIKTSGYALPDGSLLNFSHDGTSRDMDHREISWPESEGSTEKMIAFMNAGAMRIDANSGSIDLRVSPTVQQEKVIQEISHINNGKVYIDCEIPDETGYGYSDRINLELNEEYEIDKAIKKIRNFYKKSKNY